MKTITTLLLLTLISQYNLANNITVSYAPTAKVKGDLAEDDLISDDDYSHLTLDPGRARSIKWVGKNPFISEVEITTLYVEYMSIDTESDNGFVSEDKFQTLTFGAGAMADYALNRGIDLYGSYHLGIGVARFDFDDAKYYALGEAFVEGGVLLFKHMSVGIGFKHQTVGYPSETMATANYVFANVGIRF